MKKRIYPERSFINRGFFPLALLASILFFTSCELGIDTLRVTGCSPVKGATGLTRDVMVVIQFSSAVNRTDAESLFTLKQGDTGVEGRFDWDSGSGFTFTPVSQLEKNGRYVINIPRSIRDSKGNTMGSDYLSDFYVGSDFSNPQISASVPAYTEGVTPDVAVNQNIIIDFSKSMNRSKTESAFSISPEPSGYFEWAASPSGLPDSRMTYVLTKPMDYGKLYKLKLSADAEDSVGNKTGVEYRVNFITGNDFIPPQVERMVYSGTDFSTDSINTGISKTAPIRIDFSENMDRQSVEKAIGITPSAQIYFDWLSDRELYIRPSVSYEPETLYQLAVETSCMDQNGYTLLSGYAVEFRTDADDSLFVITDTVAGSNNNIDYSDFSSIWPVDIDMGGGTNEKYYVRIHFTSSNGQPIANGMDLYSIFDNCIIETFPSTTGGASIHDPAKITDISWIDDSTVIIQMSGLTNTALSEQPALYRLTVSGGKSGVKDRNGNYMQNDYIVEFKEVL